jgi:hypothetical protein
MTIFEIIALVVLILFVMGEFFNIPRFGRRPGYKTAVWKLNVGLLIAWCVGCSLLLTGLRGGNTLLLIISILWVIGQLRTHWFPYLFGAPEEYRSEYKMIFRDNLTVLPRITHRGVVPDLYHTLIIISLIILIFSGIRMT